MPISINEFNKAVDASVLKKGSTNLIDNNKFDSLCKLNLMLFLDQKFNFSISFEKLEKLKDLDELNKLIND